MTEVRNQHRAGRSSAARMILTGFAVAAAACGSALAVPGHPDELAFSEIEFQPPEAGDYRTEIAGVPVYMAPSSELPLITIAFSFRGGEYLVPAEHAGLSGMTATMMRTGGTTSMTPAEVDEEFAYLAANVSVGMGETSAVASMNCLSANFEQAFGLFMDVVRNPGWDQKRLDTARGQVLEGLKQRNDNGVAILLREGARLMYGEDHFAGRQPTGASIESIGSEELQSFHDRVFHPGNLIIAVSGDFEPSEMRERLAKAIEGWPRGEISGEVPEPTAEFEPGIYYVEKEQEQGQVVFMQRGISRDDPDAIPVSVMNDILGGSGFTSRITKRVRTDEGLAYTAGSAVRTPVDYPGDFIAYYFSKVPTVAQAGRVVVEEVDKMRNTEVGTDELDTVKSNIIETFPRTFESRAGTLAVFVGDEQTGRDPDYWQTYRDRVEAVTAGDVQRVASKYLDPNQMVMLIVGPWEQIRAGNTATEDDPSRVVTMDDILTGEFNRLPKRDPVTLKPIKGE